MRGKKTTNKQKYRLQFYGKKFKIGIIQTGSKRLDLKYNFNKSVKLIKKAAKKGAEIVVTPECMLDGYSFDRFEFKNDPEKYSITLDGPYMQKYIHLCKDLNINAIIGCSLRESVNIFKESGIEEIKSEDSPIYRNSAVLIDSEGDIAGVYNKAHSTYGNYEAKFYRLADELPVFNIRGEYGAVTIGIMICYDRQIPETARTLAVKGAKIIFNPAATGNFTKRWNSHLIQTRAYENGVYVVCVNHAFPRLNGHSFAYSPSKRLIGRMGYIEGIKIISIPYENIQRSGVILKTRRPELYSDIIH